ncbi:MAG: hypothetical protein ACR2OZ_10580 [Verrucomicrobiales bacterium]
MPADKKGMPLAAAANASSTILIAVTGLSPAIVTETVWALAKQRPRLLPERVVLKSDLDSERRAMEKQWARREKHIAAALTNTAGLYGSIQGIVGQNTLPELKILSLPDAE